MPFLLDPVSLANPDPAGADESVGLFDFAKEAGKSAVQNLFAIPTAAGQLQAASRGDAEGAEAARGLNMMAHGAMDWIGSTQSDAAKDAQANPGRHILGTAGLQAAGAIPVIGGFAAMNALFPPSILGDVALGAGLQTGSVIDTILSRTNAMNDVELAKASPVFRQMLDKYKEQGLDQDKASAKARSEFANAQVTNQDLLISALTGAATGGVLGRFVKGSGNEAENGILKSMGIGAAEGAPTMAIGAGQTNYTMQGSDVAMGMKSAIDYGQVIDEAMLGALGGATIGGAMGGFHGWRAKGIEPVGEKAPNTAESDALNDTLNGGNRDVTNQSNVAQANAGLDEALAGQEQRRAAADQMSDDQIDQSPNTTPEAPATFEKQVQDLADGNRAAVLFPAGKVKVKDRPKRPRGMKVHTNEDGTFYYDPKKTNPDQINQLTEDNRLNEILGMADTSKVDAVRDVQAGADPAAVVLRDADGTPKVEAASSSATAEQDAQQIAAQGKPTDTVEITDPNQVIADRNAANAEPPAPKGDQVFDQARDLVLNDNRASTSYIQRKLGIGYNRAATIMERLEAEGVVTKADKNGKRKVIRNDDKNQTDTALDIVQEPVQEAAPQRVTPEGNRILESQTEASKAAEEDWRAKYDEEVAAAEAQAKAEAEKGRDRNKAVTEERKRNNASADSVFADEQLRPHPTEAQLGNKKDKGLAAKARVITMSRFKALLKAAEAAGFKDFGRDRTATSEARKGANHSPAAVFLHDLIKVMNKKTITDKDLVELRSSEERLRGGGKEALDEIRSEKRAEDDLRNSQGKPKDEEGNEFETPKEAVGKNAQGDVVPTVEDVITERETAKEEAEAAGDEETLAQIREEEAALAGPKRDYAQGPLAQKLLEQERARKAATEKPEGKVLTDEEVRAEEFNRRIEELERAASKHDGSEESLADAYKKAEKVRELMKRGATEGERAAARAALDRLSERIEEMAGKVQAKAEESPEGYTAFGEAKAAPVFKKGERIRDTSNRPKGAVKITLKGKAKLDRSSNLERLRRLIEEVRDNKEEDQTILLTDKVNHEVPAESIVSRKPFGELMKNTVNRTFMDGTPFNTKLSKLIMKLVARRMKERIKDMDVMIVKDAEMDRMLEAMGMDPEEHLLNGFYAQAENMIVIREGMTDNGRVDENLLVHEGMHALTQHTLDSDPKFRKIVEKLLDHVRKETGWVKDDENGAYGLTDVHEFISEAFSDPDFQGTLSMIEVTPKMMADLGLDRATGNKLWDAIVAAVEKYVLQHFPWTPKDGHTALSAIMRATARIDIKAEAGEAGKGSGVKPMLTKRELLDKVNEAKVNPSAFGRGILRGAQTTSMIARGAERLGAEFGKMARRVADITQLMDKASATFLERKGGGLEIVREGAELQRKYKDRFSDMLDVMFRASELNVNLDRTNEHLGKDAVKGWQGKKQFDALKARFDAMPEDLKSWALKAVEFGREEREAEARDLIKRILKGAGIEDADLAERIYQGTMTEADEGRFKTDKIIRHLKEVATLHQMGGWYVPFLREGDYVVGARRAVAEPTGSNVHKLSDNTFLFMDPKRGTSPTAARKAAKEFIENHELPIKEARPVWVDKNDPTKTLPSEDLNAVPAFRVEMQNEHFELFKTQAEAEARARELKADGLKDVYTDLLRQNPNTNWGGIASSQYEILINSLRNRDSFKRMSPAEQANLIQAMREANIKLLPGTRIQKNNLRRKNVAGYSRDLINSIARYAQNSANYRAKLKYQAELDETLRSMGKYIDENRGSGDAIRQREVLRELETRTQAASKLEPDSPLANTLRRLRQASMIDKLAGVSFHVINSVEPTTTSLPYIGGRHGMAQTSNMLYRAYSLIGAKAGVVAGIKDTGRAFNSDTGFTSYLDMFKRSILQNAQGERGRRLASVLDDLDKHNLFGHEAGMEMGRVASPSSNLVGRALDRADVMARQVGSTIEAINRAVTGLTAYELEFKRNGGNHEAALAYARDTVDVTMGNYAASNASPIFNSPIGAAALQFKKFAQKTYYLLGTTARESLKGNREAQKQFAGLMFTHAVVAGVLGLPLEPIKVALLVSNALGLTSYTYQDFEELVRSTAKNMIGATAGEALTRGIPRLAGIDVSSRMSLADLLTFSTPRSNSAADMKSWLFDTMAGAPAGLILQQIAGMQELSQGNFAKAAEKMIPIKAARDINQAVSGYISPKTNKFGRQTMGTYTPYEAGLRAIGFKPAREAEAQEQRSAVGGDVYKYNQDRQQLIRDWVNAPEENRAKQMIAIQKFNYGLPTASQISRVDLRNAEKSRKTEERKGTNVNGMRFSKRTEFLKDELGTYNTGQ